MWFVIVFLFVCIITVPISPWGLIENIIFVYIQSMDEEGALSKVYIQDMGFNLLTDTFEKISKSFLLG